jgi:hypothetical protein
MREVNVNESDVRPGDIIVMFYPRRGYAEIQVCLERSESNSLCIYWCPTFRPHWYLGYLGLDRGSCQVMLL